MGNNEEKEINVETTSDTELNNDSVLCESEQKNKLLFFPTNIVIIVCAICLVAIFLKVNNIMNEIDTFHLVSLKANSAISDKDEAIYYAYENIKNVTNTNNYLSSSNLNLAFAYGNLVDDEDRSDELALRNLPVPVTMDEDKTTEDESNKSIAFKIFEKLQNRYRVLNTNIYNLCGTNPVNIVRQYHYDGYSIIGKYNPQVPTHVKGKRHTYFIQNFSNVNVTYKDGDGNIIEDDNNIRDIMSMASVYTYYHDPYDSKTFLKYCYNMFDSSYAYVASISEVYYCSGCMYYNDPDVATSSSIYSNVSLDKIPKQHSVQKVLPKDIPYKAGTLKRMNENSYITNDGTYNEYVEKIKHGIPVTFNNYCPGHVDLNIDVTVLTLNSNLGLTIIDKNYGNKGSYFNKYWHGWDPLMIKKARDIYNRDWESDYGISISYVDFVKPLTQEEINFYLNRLNPNLSANRKKLIETALKSVGRIPYYYGGKTNRAGYDQNAFGTKIATDYKGRCLKGLDCSGWVSWVYLTAFNKYLVKSEGTQKLASEGTKITRDELLPGDIIVRPGIDSHVMMFLEWGPNGQVKVIHENGAVNNVSIGTFDAYYPHYRRLLNT